MARCRFCAEDAGFLRRQHGDCRDAFERAYADVSAVAAEAAQSHQFDAGGVRGRIDAFAEQGRMQSEDVRGALSAGLDSALHTALGDGRVSTQEERAIRNFCDAFGIRLATGRLSKSLDRRFLDGAARRLQSDAQAAALAARDGQAERDRLAAQLESSLLAPNKQRAILIDAWTDAVDEVLEDGLLELDEQQALGGYLSRFGLSRADVDRDGAYERVNQAAILRDVADGQLPDPPSQRVPFNLMKSEQLVWLCDDARYYKETTRREFRGSSHGLSIRVAKGLYYRPSTFRGRSVSVTENVHAGTGLLGLTTKHVYFHGGSERFRVRYSRIVSFEPYSDGFGLMRDNQRAKPETFITGDGWFIYNLVSQLAQFDG